jgi:hypothetical protein
MYQIYTLYLALLVLNTELPCSSINFHAVA